MKNFSFALNRCYLRTQDSGLRPGRQISVPRTFLGRIKFAKSLMVKRFGTAGRLIYPKGGPPHFIDHFILHFARRAAVLSCPAVVLSTTAVDVGRSQTFSLPLSAQSAQLADQLGCRLSAAAHVVHTPKPAYTSPYTPENAEFPCKQAFVTLSHLKIPDRGRKSFPLSVTLCSKISVNLSSIALSRGGGLVSD